MDNRRTQCNHIDSVCKLSTPRDLTPGDYDAPVFSLGGQDDYAFSPDGQEICYASNHDPEPAISTNNDLFTVPVNFPGMRRRKMFLQRRRTSLPKTRPPTTLRSIRRMASTSPIARSSVPGYESDRWRLMLYDRKTEEEEHNEYDGELWGWIESVTWVSGRTKPVYHSLLTSDEEGNSTIFEVYTDPSDLTSMRLL